MNRKSFIKISAALAAGNSLFGSCHTKKSIHGKIIGNHAARGHLLRDRQWGSATEIIKKDIVIIGAGISGLSAGRYLHQNGYNDFVVLDLGEKAGGNAIAGSNELSAYPWGAHYIPIPNPSQKEYLDFLEHCGVIKETDTNGLPVYNEEYLCFDPEERLYINGRWQEGLIPSFGLPESDVKQITAFLQQMNDFRYKTANDGKEYFAIPVDWSAANEELRQLDQTTMEEWMRENGYTSEYLHRYINYCCRDDFGTPHHLISAWAGIHYFASRKGKGANASHDDVLTWPEGNAFLAAELMKGIADKILTQALVTRVIVQDDAVLVEYAKEDNQLRAITAKHCVLAIPQFVAARILKDPGRNELVKANLEYSPWMVANFRVNKLVERSGAPMSWDNVIHDSESLGYVEATHQLLKQFDTYRNLTYYLPLTRKKPFEERTESMKRNHEDWVKIVIDDLKKVHPNIEEAIQEMNILLWGHAMVQPRPGYISGSVRKQLAASIKNRLHFAHTDLSGISIFEEGFYQGITAAKKIISNISS